MLTLAGTCLLVFTCAVPEVPAREAIFESAIALSRHFSLDHALWSEVPVAAAIAVRFPARVGVILWDELRISPPPVRHDPTETRVTPD